MNQPNRLAESELVHCVSITTNKQQRTQTSRGQQKMEKQEPMVKMAMSEKIVNRFLNPRSQSSFDHHHHHNHRRITSTALKVKRKSARFIVAHINNNQYQYNKRNNNYINNNNQAIKIMQLVSILSVCLLVALLPALQLANGSMCQHARALLEARSVVNMNGVSLAPGGQETPEVGMFRAPSQECPKASMYNSLPLAPTIQSSQQQYMTPKFERQQREIMRNLNTSFSNHMIPMASSDQNESSSLASDLIDDELLNEIVSPSMLDEAYERAKEIIVKRRKLETEMVRQGE